MRLLDLHFLDFKSNLFSPNKKTASKCLRF
nr:MAG TPA: hypothetical protein [Caudoviricetes sp.]